MEQRTPLTAKIKNWYKNLPFKIRGYVYNNTCIMLLPYISIQYSKSQGETSLGGVKWNIQMGFIYCAIQFTTTHTRKSLNLLSI